MGVRVEFADGDLAALGVGMPAEEFLEIHEHFVHGDGFCGIALAGVQDAEVAAGNFEAPDDLPVHAADVALHLFKFLALDLRGAADLFVDEFDEAVDDGEGAVEIVQDVARGVAGAHCRDVARHLRDLGLQLRKPCVGRLEILVGSALGERAPRGVA